MSQAKLIIKRFALLGLALAFGLLTSDLGGAHEGNAIAICCAWNGNLADGDLTYKISGGDDAAQSVVRTAVEEWDSVLTGMTLTEVTGKTKANINIKFKKGGGQIQGMALRHFDGNGFINRCDLNISGSAFGSPNNATTVAQITRHEVAHCFGINHANFNGDLMSPTVSGGSATISACDVAAVRAANHWKLVDEVNTPHQPHVDHVHC